MKQQCFDTIDRIAPQLTADADFIFDHPECDGQEYQAAQLLTSRLENAGFQVERGVGGMETAFRATWQSGQGGPSIGILCEYDALEGIGHACGHHLQGPAAVGAACALKELGQGNFKIVVYGTPSEEVRGGKIIMLENGCFQDIDVALMCHAAPTTCIDIKCISSINCTVTFRGTSAHAAMNPEQGRSAFDALLLAFQGVEFLREHVLEDTRMHYTVLNAGGPSNVVPGVAVGDFCLRSYNGAYLESLIRRFENIVKGAALMSGVDYEIQRGLKFMSKIPVLKLNELLMDNAKLLHAPQISPPRQKTGSTDFGNVMYQVPGSCIRVAFVPVGTAAHSQAYLDAGKTQAAHQALIYAAKIIAGTAVDLISDPGKMNEIREEFIHTKEAMMQTL